MDETNDKTPQDAEISSGFSMVDFIKAKRPVQKTGLSICNFMPPSA
jgi:hypothetical protein